MFNEPRMRYSKCPASEFRGFLIGEVIRDWSSSYNWWVWYPYTKGTEQSDMLRQLWYWRTTLANRATFQGKMADAGLQWYEYMQHTASAYYTPLSIAYAEVATHNHFVLDRGGKVFKQTAPVIKLPESSSANDHLRLVGVLNSSTACFWLRQVCHDKGGGGIGGGIATETWEHFFVFNATNLEKFPLPNDYSIELGHR